jgi:hypothetical protein
MRNAYKIKMLRKIEDLGGEGRTVLQSVAGKLGWRVWAGLLWLRIGSGGRLL